MTSPSGPRLFPESGRELRAHDRGVLPFEHLRELVREGVLAAEDGIDEAQLQPASIDLRLGSYALQVRASFLPGRGTTVLEAVEDLLIQRIDLECGAVLQKGAVYIIPLLETLNRKDEQAVFFLQIKDNKGVFPMLGIEQKMDGAEVSRLEATRVTKGEQKASLFEIPAGYNKFERN